MTGLLSWIAGRQVVDVRVRFLVQQRRLGWVTVKQIVGSWQKKQGQVDSTFQGAVQHSTINRSRLLYRRANTFKNDSPYCTSKYENLETTTPSLPRRTSKGEPSSAQDTHTTMSSRHALSRRPSAISRCQKCSKLWIGVSTRVALVRSLPGVLQRQSVGARRYRGSSVTSPLSVPRLLIRWCFETFSIGGTASTLQYSIYHRQCCHQEGAPQRTRHLRYKDSLVNPGPPLLVLPSWHVYRHPHESWSESLSERPDRLTFTSRKPPLAPLQSISIVRCVLKSCRSSPTPP